MTKRKFGIKFEVTSDGLEKLVEALVGDITNKVASAVREGVEDIIDDAATQMEIQYQAAMADEPNTKNKISFLQGNPADALRMQEVKDGIGSGTKNVYHAGNIRFSGLKRTELTFSAIDPKSLDAVPDRTQEESISVTIAIPVRTAGGHVSEMGGNPDLLVNIKTITIHGRGSKVSYKDRKTGDPWRLWRAIEYGNAGGRAGRVHVREVVSYKTAGTYTASRKGEDEVRIVAYKDSLVLGEELVFMSGKWKWWEAIAEQAIGISVDPPHSFYEGGKHPIQMAIDAGGGHINARVRNALSGSTQEERLYAWRLSNLAKANAAKAAKRAARGL